MKASSVVLELKRIHIVCLYPSPQEVKAVLNFYFSVFIVEDQRDIWSRRKKKHSDGDGNPT